METLRVSLDTYYADVVERIAVANEIPEAAEHTKSELVDLLVEEIPLRAGDPDRIAALPEEARAVLAVVLEEGGQTKPSDVAVPLALGGVVRLGSMNDRPDALPPLDEVLNTLLQQGLLVNLTPPVNGATRRKFSPLRYIAIPPEVVQVLPQDLLQVPEPQPDLWLTPPPERVEQRPLSEVLRTLFFIWAELRREPASALKAGGIYKRDARRLARSMSVPFSENEDEIRFFVDLLLQMRLLFETRDEVCAIETEDSQNFWQQMPVVQARRLLTAIIETVPDLSFDFSALQAVRSYVYQTLHSRPADMLFDDVIDLFGQMTENVWFPLDTFLALLSGDRVGTFLFSEQNVAGLYQRLRWYGLQGSLSARKRRLEQALREVERQALIRLLKHLRRLGIVMLGYDREGDEPKSLRPTPLAHAALTGRSYEDLGDQVGQIILQPDFQLLAMGPVSLKMLSRIERIAKREKVQPAAISYRITRDSIYYALQIGETLSDILHFLEAATATPIPQNVERTLHEWGRQHERIVLRQPVLVLQVDRPERLQVLLNDPDVGEAIHRLDATTAWVPSRSALKIERRLWELEMLPALSRGRETDLPRSLRWDEDEGCLHPRHPLPSLYVVGNVERFAELIDGSWRLTPGSVRQAVKAGLDVPEIMAMVEEMTSTALSTEWEKRLKAWGGHYGDAQTARVRLLRFETAEAVKELREAERTLRRRLHPIGGQNGAVVVVEEKHWGQVKGLLDEWGVAVEESVWW